jgi:hypothetical protein
MFKKISEMETKHQVIFSVIIAFSVVSFWRGVWGLMDEYLLPANYRGSLWISLLLGIGILIITNYATKELM